MGKMQGNQFPPRGPRSNHIKIDVTTEERKAAEEVAQQLGCTVVEAYKTAMRHEARRLRDVTLRGDPESSVTRGAR